VQLVTSFLNCNLLISEIRFERRGGGEPDRGFAFEGQYLPFMVFETGYSDTGEKTRSRARNWLLSGQGNVYRL
jgi:hypothetical protein